MWRSSAGHMSVGKGELSGKVTRKKLCAYADGFFMKARVRWNGIALRMRHVQVWALAYGMSPHQLGCVVVFLVVL
jgi:hypothetical protein